MLVLLSSLKKYAGAAIQALKVAWDVWHAQDGTGSPEAKQDQKNEASFLGRSG